MIYRFETFELDTDRAELRSAGAPVAVEPQVLSLLTFLIENRDRLVSRDDIIASVWGGRFISDAAVASRIKSARQAVGDDGAAQRVIKTVHGRGIRFVAEVFVDAVAPAAVMAGAKAQLRADPPSPPVPDAAAARPSIAVLPFRLVGIGGPITGIAEALPQDLISELSRLHWLLVIARVSSFRFRGTDAELSRVRTELRVRYCLTGVVEIAGGGMTVSVELCDTETMGVVWSDRFRARLDDVHAVREDIARAVVTALDMRIPLHEAGRARLLPSENLDAWSAFHLGLHHMYSFTKEGNAKATALFERSISLDPNFSRGYAGLSFTHFQNAFLRHTDDIAGETDMAHRFAELALERDAVDPFASFTMGRAHWLRGDLEGSLPWLERANTLNPNYAQAKYSSGWAQSLIGEAKASIENVGMAYALSPLDPMTYAMFGARAFAHISLGEMEAAAHWAERAANAPGAHALIELEAVAAHGLNGNDARARTWGAAVRARTPVMTSDDFFRAFPFRDPQTCKRIAAVLKQYGF